MLARVRCVDPLATLPTARPALTLRPLAALQVVLLSYEISFCHRQSHHWTSVLVDIAFACDVLITCIAPVTHPLRTTCYARQLVR